MRKRADRILDRIGAWHYVEFLILIPYRTFQGYVGIFQILAGVDCLDVAVNAVAVRVHQHRVQAYAFLDYRRLHVAAETPVLVGDEPFVAVDQPALGVVVERLLRTHVVAGIEIRLRNVGTVGFQLIYFGQIALEELFELEAVNETAAVGDDSAEEALVLLVAPELAVTVFFSGDIYRLEGRGVAVSDAGKGKVRYETELPFRVLQTLRDQYLERQVYLAVTLGDLIAAADYHRSHQFFRSHHLPRFLIEYGVHYDGLVLRKAIDLAYRFGLYVFTCRKTVVRIAYGGDFHAVFLCSDLLKFLLTGTRLDKNQQTEKRCQCPEA